MKIADDGAVWAYSYLRFSASKQEEGDSVRRQQSPIPGWLKRNPHVRLDRSLQLEDRGVSGMTGEHRKDPKYAMARFLQHVESRRVGPGSFLLVENLDRMTREHPVHAIPWVLSLIAKGINVVQFQPFEVTYDVNMDQGKLERFAFGCSSLPALCRGLPAGFVERPLHLNAKRYNVPALQHSSRTRRV